MDDLTIFRKATKTTLQDQTQAFLFKIQMERLDQGPAINDLLAAMITEAVSLYCLLAKNPDKELLLRAVGHSFDIIVSEAQGFAERKGPGHA